MNENNEPIEALIQYLDGELQGDRLLRLQEEIDADPTLRDKLDNLRIAREGLQRFGLRQQIKAIHQEMVPGLAVRQTPPLHSTAWSELSTYRKFSRVSLSAAAVLILVIGLGTLYQYLSISPGKLYKDHYHAFMIGEDRGTATIDPLRQAYRNGRIKEVITLFNTRPDHAIGDYFLAGNAYLQSDSAQKAVDAFISLQNINKEKGTHIYEDDAEYYLALSYLRNDRPGLAIPIFEKIHADPGHAYHDKVGTWFLVKLHWLRSRP